MSKNKKISLLIGLTFLVASFLFIQTVRADDACDKDPNSSACKSQQSISKTLNSSSSKGANTTYTPMEKIPGSTSISDFPSYVKAIYKFGIWTIGIAALLMIMIGGFMYMTSAGNNATMGKAKGYITDALIGLVMAMTAYLLLYTINPDLVNVKIKFPSGTSSGTGAGGSSSNSPSAADIAACTAWCDANWSSDANGLQSCKTGCNDASGYNKDSRQAACNSWCDQSGYSGDELNSCKKGCTDYANNSTASGQYTNKDMPQNCKSTEWGGLFEQASANTGVDKCLLQATAAKESSCTVVPQRTNGGRDCSVAQIAAQANCNQTCNYLEQNPDAAMTCAGNYIKKCSSKQRAGNIRDIYAGYNGGCGALDASNDCPGQKKYECTINCGGYCAVPARTAQFEAFYNQCKGS